MNNLETIINASKLGYSSKAKSILDVLLGEKWIKEKNADEAYDWIEEQVTPSAVAFFQLPFPILLPSEEIMYKFSGIDLPIPLVTFELIGSPLNSIELSGDFKIQQRKKFTENDVYSNARLKNEKTGVINRTQVCIKFKLWRFWKEYHPQYVDSIFKHGNIKNVLYKVPIGNSRRHLVDQKGTTITAGKFEYDLAKRLRLESLHIINKFIKFYSVSCRHSLPHKLNTLNNFFIMVEGGRVVTLGPGPSMITQELEKLQTDTLSRNLENLNKYFESGRETSIYEQYLLNSISLIEEGSYNLSVVYVAMILEWFSNELIDDRFKKELLNNSQNELLVNLCIKKMWRESNSKGVRVTVKDRFTKYFPALGIKIPDNMLNQVIEIINNRNKIVHGNQSNHITREVAEKTIDVALNFVDFIMNDLIAHQKK